MSDELRIWRVYILRCNDGTLYTGITIDMTNRLRQHNGSIQGGAKYTALRRPVELLYYEVCDSQSEAMKRERAIKKFNRDRKLKLCESFVVLREDRIQ